MGQFHGMAQVIYGDINHTLNGEEGNKVDKSPSNSFYSNFKNILMLLCNVTS